MDIRENIWLLPYLFLATNFTPGRCDCMPGSTSSATTDDFTAHLAETLGDGVWALDSKP